VAPTTAFGNASDSTRNLLEERADNGTQTAASWQSNDFEMHSCDGGEFTNTICNTASTRYLNIGMIYSGVTVPKNATITSASITLACTTPAGTSGSLTHQVYGLYKTATNPHPDAFTSSGSNQLRTPLATASLHTAASTTYSTNNCSPGNNTVVDVTSVAQEVVNNANWNPATGRMGFAFQRTAGSGSRHLLKAGNQLSISYSTSTVAQAANTESIGQWDDLSGNGNNAIFAFGNAPTRQDNQINAKTVVRFNGGAMLSSLVSALSGKREMTVFAVMKTNYGTSNSDGRAITGMSSSGTNDTTSGTSIIPLLRSGTNSGFSSLYSGSATTYRTNFTCGATCASTAYLYDTVFTINDSDSIDATLKGNGVPVATKNNMSPSGSPYTFGLNQFYFGGRRNGAMPGTGADYLNGDYAELVVYDKVLTCRQIEALEEYFRAKWAISASQYSTTCPADLVPVL
jgi:hypothetical protein